MDDYAGVFDPRFRLEQLSHATLARLGREYMLFGHFHDRGLMPLIGSRYGREAMTQVACDEWMGASPIYNRRVREMLGIPGDGVSAILKSLQLDVGFAHRYMDVWIEDCEAFADGEADAGLALLDGADRPGFESVVTAVNPRARCTPTGKRAWRIDIDPNTEPRAEAPLANAVRVSNVAAFDLGAERDA